MAMKPKRMCGYPGCNILTNDKYCEEHKQKINQYYDNKRGTPTQRGYNSKWRKASKLFLASHPWCVECLKKSTHEPATETDHIIPHKGNMKLFWDKTNWQGLCHSCHSIKTAKEDGGFGNK
nr:HNH endonuclease signature motif containing protein [Sedimentibacter sp.]